MCVHRISQKKYSTTEYEMKVYAVFPKVIKKKKEKHEK